MQILTVFPAFVVQQIRNSSPCARSIRAASKRPSSIWIYLGFVDDDEAMPTTA